MREKAVTRIIWEGRPPARRSVLETTEHADSQPLGSLDSQIARLYWMWRLGVAKQRLEPKVHVLLDMAMKQRKARLVGNQIHGGASKCGHDHCIFLDARTRLSVDLDELEHVPVEVHRVAVVTPIVKHQPVAASLSEYELPFMRIFLAVDEPVIDPVWPARHFFKDHVYGLVWRWVRRGLAKDGVVPARLRRR